MNLTRLFAVSVLLSMYLFDAQASQQPNVIVILADDLGYADVGFHDVVAKDAKTPHLDALARSGVIFRNAYSSSPVCSNSRLALSTGRYQHRWGAYYYGQGGLPSTEHTLAEMMKKSGYRTMKVGKTHLNKGPKSHPLDHGFDHSLGFKQHSWDFHLISEKDAAAYEKKKPGSVKRSGGTIGLGPLTRDRDTPASFENTTTTEVFGEESISFIEEKSDEPFYLQLEFNAVHTPLYRAPSAEMARKFGIPERPFDRDAKVWPFPLWDPVAQPDFKAWYGQTCHLKVLDPYGRKIYLSHLALMDEMIGNIIKTLKDQGRYENTLIFFSSDNGGSDQSYANNGDINAFKYCLMDGGIKVPMVVSWPGKFEAGKKVDALVTHRDLFATLSEITKVAPSNPLDGKSLLPLIDGSVQSIHQDETLCWDSGSTQKNWVARQGDWKLVFRKEGKIYHRYQLDDQGLVKSFKEVPIASGYQLYHLADDPGETTNLSIQFPERVAQLKKQYTMWRANMSDPIRGVNAK